VPSTDVDRPGSRRTPCSSRHSHRGRPLRHVGDRSRPDEGAWRRLGRCRFGHGRRPRYSGPRSRKRLGGGDPRGFGRPRRGGRLGLHRDGLWLDGCGRCGGGDCRIGRGDRRGDGYAGREQRRRVEVAVGLGGQPDAEVDMRRRRDLVLAQTDPADDGSFGDRAASSDGHHPELEERDGVPVCRLDRHGPAAARDGAREGDGTGRWRADGVADEGGDVDSAVLARSVGVRPDRERSQHLTVGGPDPAGCSRSDCQERDRDDRERERTPHRTPPSWEEGNCVPR
jgi:hypothetical protein